MEKIKSEVLVEDKVLKLTKIEVERYKTFKEKEMFNNKFTDNELKEKTLKLEKEIDIINLNKGKINLSNHVNKYFDSYYELKSGVEIEEVFKSSNKSEKKLKELLSIIEDKKVQTKIENYLEKIILDKNNSLGLTF